MSDSGRNEIKGYELYELIGKGGFGSVYRAFQPLINREVAIKVINAEYANNIHFILHFEVEAQLIARLEHPHIVPLYDYWREPNNAYLVMRWLRGGSLYHSLKQRDVWSIKAIAKLIDQMASALAAAHRHGVIHRDLKPANILLDEDHNAYLSDFGIAKDLTKSKVSILSSDDSVRHGSPAYMSPEQIMGVEVNSRTDIYSLGIVTYELLSGAKPFQATTDEGLMRQQLTEELPSLHATHPQFPAEIDSILKKATNKDPRARYHSPVAFADDFRRVMLGDAGEPPSLDIPAAPAPKPGEVRDLIEIAEHLVLEIQNPYKGLRAFQEADASDFCGRDKLIENLLFRISEVTEGSRFLAVVGPSGSGKSSVVKAGVIPALRRGRIPGSGLWFIVETTPHKHPLKQLENALLRIATRPLPGLGELLQRDAGGLLEAVEQAIPSAAGELVLVIDQFEEVFTLTQDEHERTHFLNSLLMAINAATSRLRIIVTLRADFYDRPLLYPGFGELMRNRTEVVLPLSEKELEAAIVQPAERVGLSLEPGLVNAIVADVNEQPGTLPLLQFALTELFANRKGTSLTLGAYRANGGVSGALTRRADETMALMSPRSREITRQVFLRLVALGDGVEETRRRVLQSELMSMQSDQQALQQVLDNFNKHRLLTFDYEPGTRAPTVEIAHEALIREWKQLREWLDTSRDELRVQRRLAAATHDWIQSKRDSSYLASGARLTEFEALASITTLALNQEERDYIRASLALRERARRRLHGFIALLVILLIASLVATVFAIDRQQRSVSAQATAVAERDRANLETLRSRSRELAVTALINESQFDLSLLLGLEGLHSADTFEARNSLLTILQSKPNLRSILHPVAAPVRSVALSPNGTIIASAGEDARIALWDGRTYQPLGQPLVGHTETVNALAFSPDGTLLASAGEDDTIILWDTADWQPVGEPLTGHTDAVWALAFSPDGRILASASADNTVRLWNAKSGRPITQPLAGHDDAVYSLAFSPDGRRLASGSADNNIRLWNIPSSPLEPITSQTLEGHANWVLALAFSPDGKTLASGSANNTIRLWDIATRQTRVELRGHRNWVRALVWGADAQTLISGSQEGRMVIWNLAENRAVQELIPSESAAVWSLAFDPNTQTLVSGGGSQVAVWKTQPNRSALSRTQVEQKQAVAHVAFSPDGRWLATADSSTDVGARTDSAIHLWDVSQPDPSEVAALRGHIGIITGIAFSPDSTWLVSSSTDAAVVLWDTASSAPIATLRDENSVPIFSVALSPDGQRIAVGGIDGSITLWAANADTMTGWQRAGEPLWGHTDRVLSLAFSPDGNTLASGSRDGTVRLWDSAARQQRGEPLTAHTDGITSLAFSPDGRLLASGGRDNVVHLWNIAAGDITEQPLVGHLNWIQSVTFSPDGTLLASSSADNTIRLWDTEQMRPLGKPLSGHTNWVTSVAFSPDSQTLASGGLDKTLILWDVGMRAWEARACQMANRNLTTEEWERYLPESPYRLICPQE